MKEKKLPSFVRNPLVYRFFQSKSGRLLSNWALQGMLYMNPVEIAYKLFLDVVMTVPVWMFLPIQVEPWRVLSAWIIAHTINWIINCQPIALLWHLDWGKHDANHFIAYIEGLERRIQNRPYLAAAASFGSLSRGKYKDTSDIDIRVVLGKGLFQRLQAANYCFIERFRAAINRFPLDLYAFDLDEMERKMSKDEIPVIFMDPDSLLGGIYAETISFDSFRQRFRREVLGESNV